jgi:hypothetical protein
MIQVLGQTPKVPPLLLHRASCTTAPSMGGRIIAREETRPIGNETWQYEKKLGLTILGVPTMSDKARLWILRMIPFFDCLN